MLVSGDKFRKKERHKRYEIMIICVSLFKFVWNFYLYVLFCFWRSACKDEKLQKSFVETLRIHALFHYFLSWQGLHPHWLFPYLAELSGSPACLYCLSLGLSWPASRILYGEVGRVPRGVDDNFSSCVL